MFQPLPIKFEEDKMRRAFFRDHPWELARPRVVVESSGKDFERYDWSRIQQPGKQLDGERYVLLLIGGNAEVILSSICPRPFPLDSQLYTYAFSLQLVLFSVNFGSLIMCQT